jgi:alpha-ketoglutarate-dependent taurine dioxygenase
MMSQALALFPNQPDPASPLTIVPVAGRIGGEVQGLALSADLNEAVLAALHNALARHKVLFFRDQHRLWTMSRTRCLAAAGASRSPTRPRRSRPASSCWS